QTGTTPATRLVYVPCHFHGDDITKSTGADIFIGCMVVCATAPLGTNLYDFSGSFHSFSRSAVIFHCLRKGLLHIHVSARFNGFLTMQGMLEIRRADNNGIHILPVIELIVIPNSFDLLARSLLYKGHSLVPSLVPEIGYSGKFKIEFLGMAMHGGNQCSFASIGKTDNSDIYTIISADD